MGESYEISWLDPYLVGFMSTLITLVATREAGHIGSEAIGLVQSEAWAEMTGLEAALIGEQICLLSANGHRDFMQGCRNAGTFERSAARGGGVADPVPIEPDQAARQAQVTALWIKYFDDHLA